MMINKEKFRSFPKIRVWRYLPILIILGLAVHLLVPQITTLEHSWSVVKGLSWWALVLAIIAQVLSYFSSGYLLHTIMKTNEQDLQVSKGTLITVASQSIGLVAGGWVASAAATYHWIRHSSQESNMAVLAGTLPSLLNNAVLILVGLVGTIYLLIVRDLSNLQLVEFIIVLIVLGILASIVVASVKYPAATTRAVGWFSSRWMKLRRKPYDPNETAMRIENLVLVWKSLGKGKWLQPMTGAILNVSFDILTLFLVFLAAGHKVSLEVLLAGYGLPLLLGKMAFLFPGGVGIVEGSMVALYDSLQVPNAISVVVILGYRLISFWLPTILGFIAAGYLSRSQAGNREVRPAKPVDHTSPESH